MPKDTVEVYSDAVRVYDLVCGHRDNEADFYARYLSIGRTFLEIGCGTGMLSEHLVRRGFDVTGIDNSPEMAALFKSKLPGSDFVEGDMRDFDLGRQFDLVTIPYNTLSHMADPSEVVQTLRCLRKHCKADGRLIFDLRHFSQTHHPTTAAGIHVEHFYDTQSDTVNKLCRMIEVDPANDHLKLIWSVVDQDMTQQFHRFEIETTLFSNDVLADCISKAGFEVEDCFSDYQCTPFDVSSETQIFVARPVE